MLPSSVRIIFYVVIKVCVLPCQSILLISPHSCLGILVFSLHKASVSCGVGINFLLGSDTILILTKQIKEKLQIFLDTKKKIKVKVLRSKRHTDITL